MKIITALCVLLLSASKAATALAQPAEAAVYVAILDENERPLTNGLVVATFERLNSNGEAFEPTQQRVHSDTNGIVFLRGRNRQDVDWRIEASGYYNTYPKPLHFSKRENGRWLPWGRTNIFKLKRVVAPIPMYAKRIGFDLPEKGTTIGFDFVEGDWTKPYGKGRNTDILFRQELTQKGADDLNRKLVVSFPNRGDGLMPFMGPRGYEGSVLRSDHEAPAEGYLLEWTQYYIQRPGVSEESNIDDGRNYYFRVRTVLDAKGRIKSANYGKIYGDFMNSTYYFNPQTNSLNVEFDPSMNLFTNRSFATQVNRP